LLLPSLKNPALCPSSTVANPNFNPDLLPLDLSRGGSQFQFTGTGNVDEYAGYIQDTATFGNLTLNVGIRGSRYNAFGTIKDSQAEPRTGVSYLIRRTGTVLRAGYAHTIDALQRESSCRDGSRRVVPYQCVFFSRASGLRARQPEPIQRWFAAGTQPVCSDRGRLLLEVHK
jgi:hypothetical protein